MKISDNLNLSIETTFAGGSISLLEKDREVDFWIGKSRLSKSEDILVALDSVLKKNKVKKNQIERVFVTTGPGSFTGIRIGMSFALGFCKSLKCSASGVSVMEALKFMDFDNGIYKEKIYAYIYNTGKVYTQSASDNDRKLNFQNKIEKFELEEFLNKSYLPDRDIRVFINPELSGSIENLVGKFEKDSGKKLCIQFRKHLNLAKYTGIAGYNLSAYNKFSPLYL